MRLIIKVSFNYNGGDVPIPRVEAVVPKSKNIKNGQEIAKNLLVRDFHLLHVLDLGLLSFILKKSSTDLSSCYFVVFNGNIVNMIGVLRETVRRTDHYALGDYCSAANLYVVFVDSHVPGHFRDVRVFAWK